MDIVANNITSNKLEAEKVTINNKDVFTWFKEQISSVTQLTGTVNDLNEQITEVKNDLTDVSGKVTQLETKNSDLEGKVTTNISNITENKSHINENTQNISTLSTNVGKISTDITTNTTDITQIKNDVETISNNVSANISAISQIKTNIETISNNVTTIQSELNNVSTYCNSLKEKISSINDELSIGYFYSDETQKYENLSSCTNNADDWFIAFKPEYLGIKKGGYLSKLHIRSKTSSFNTINNTSFRLDWFINQNNQKQLEQSITTLNITEADTVYSFEFNKKVPILSADQYIYRLVPVINNDTKTKIGLALQPGDATQLTLGNNTSTTVVPAISVEFYNPVEIDNGTLTVFKHIFKKLA